MCLFIAFKFTIDSHFLIVGLPPIAYVTTTRSGVAVGRRTGRQSGRGGNMGWNLINWNL